MSSKDQQTKRVVAGVALGVLARGVSSVTSNKMTFEFAFNRAWRSWSGARDYPNIRGHDPGNLFWLGVQRSARRKGVYAYWDCDRMSYPMLVHEGWSVDESLELHADDMTSVRSWVDLGELFLQGFKLDEITTFGG